jgi:hypothetical protein
VPVGLVDEQLPDEVQPLGRITALVEDPSAPEGGHAAAHDAKWLARRVVVDHADRQPRHAGILAAVGPATRDL